MAKLLVATLLFSIVAFSAVSLKDKKVNNVLLDTKKDFIFKQLGNFLIRDLCELIIQYYLFPAFVINLDLPQSPSLNPQVDVNFISFSWKQSSYAHIHFLQGKMNSKLSVLCCRPLVPEDQQKKFIELPIIHRVQRNPNWTLSSNHDVLAYENVLSLHLNDKSNETILMSTDVAWSHEPAIFSPDSLTVCWLNRVLLDVVNDNIAFLPSELGCTYFVQDKDVLMLYGLSSSTGNLLKFSVAKVLTEAKAINSVLPPYPKSKDIYVVNFNSIFPPNNLHDAVCVLPFANMLFEQGFAPYFMQVSKPEPNLIYIIYKYVASLDQSFYSVHVVYDITDDKKPATVRALAGVNHTNPSATISTVSAVFLKVYGQNKLFSLYNNVHVELGLIDSDTAACLSEKDLLVPFQQVINSRGFCKGIGETISFVHFNGLDNDQCFWNDEEVSKVDYDTDERYLPVLVVNKNQAKKTYFVFPEPPKKDKKEKIGNFHKNLIGKKGQQSKKRFIWRPIKK